MASKTQLNRTVQFWRLVDARDGSLQADFDWDHLLSQMLGIPRTFTADGREYTGTVRQIAVHPSWSGSLDVHDIRDALPRRDPKTTYGVVLAAGKDYVPNQSQASTGQQRPMGLAGDGWDPVDNLYVWHLPFGNMFAVLAESTSSSRAARYADWLNRTVISKSQTDPDFAWAARPVVDPSRAALIKKAKGLRAAVYAGEIGTNVHDSSGVGAIFHGPKGIGGIRVEVKASLIRGRNKGHTDEKAILDWFTQTFGDLQGANKAQVTVATDGHVTEVDLLHHRLTFKTNVPLAPGTARSFESGAAFDSMIRGFIPNRGDLKRLILNEA